MKWFVAAAIGASSGWLISSLTDEVAIAVVCGGAIGFLATIALFGTRPAESFTKVAIAMAIGSLAGWIVSMLTGTLGAAMVMGSAIGAVATIALVGERPVLSLLKVIGAMGVGFLVGWGIGMATGNHRLGMALVIPLGLIVLTLTARTMAAPRHRPF